MLAGLSIALLIYFGLLRFDVLADLYDRPARVVICGLLLLATIPLGALRWHALLRCQGFLLPFRKTFQVVMVGQFFNTFLPGAYGGDIVRAGYIYHGARRQAGRLLMSILADRLSGLAGLISLGIAAQVALPSAIALRLSAAMLMLAIAVVALLFALPTLGRSAAAALQSSNSPLAKRLGSRGLSLLKQIATASRTYRQRPDILIGAVVLSALQFTLALLAFVVLAHAFDFATAASTTIAYAGVVSLVANSIPLTPGGIGLGEAAFANTILLVEPLATGPYATVFLASRALTLLLNLLGGFVFLAYRSEVIEYANAGRRSSEEI